MSDHDEMESSVAAWVLGALDAAEAEALRVHVEGCPSCREVAARLRRVVGALPLEVDEVAPPARLRERVLTATSAPPRLAAPQAAPVRRQSPARTAPRRMPTYALAAVALVALLIGVLLGQVTLRNQAPTQSARFTLSGHQDMSGAEASVIDLRSDGVALVDFRGLPQAGSGRVYEVWLIPAKGDPVQAAVFVPDGNGAKMVLIDRSLAGYSVMAVTNEAGPDGSRAPTQQPQLYGNIA